MKYFSIDFLRENIFKIVYYILLVIVIIIYYYRKYKLLQINKPYEDKIKVIQEYVKNSTDELVKDNSNHLFGLKNLKIKTK